MIARHRGDQLIVVHRFSIAFWRQPVHPRGEILFAMPNHHLAETKPGYMVANGGWRISAAFGVSPAGARHLESAHLARRLRSRRALR